MTEHAMDETLLVEQHAPSGRKALIADEGDSVWLYLSEPHEDAIAADCWLFNRGQVRSQAELEPKLSAYRARGVPPPVPAELQRAEGAHLSLNDIPRLRVQWSVDGEAVAAWAEHVVVGFIAPGERRGYSRFLTAAGPWGVPLDWELYRRLFLGAPG
jgi:hypothetical protein